MHVQAEKTEGSKSQAFVGDESAEQDVGIFQLIDLRPEAITQRRLQAITNNSSKIQQQKSFQALANAYTGKLVQKVAYPKLDAVVQQTPIWKPDNRADNTLDAFATALDTVVQAGAAAALTPEDLTSNDGYTLLWQETAPLVMALRDGNIDDDDLAEAYIAQRFAPARYGYAVESYANSQLVTLQAALPVGYTFQIQGGRGMTRPDFIVFNHLGHEVGWFDITSDGSIGHIDKKTGGGWNNKPYVAEITYPALDTDSLAMSGSSIGQRVKARNSAKRIREAWAHHIENYRQKFLNSYELYKSMSGESETKANMRSWAKDALSVRFYNHVVKDKLAKSLLRALGEKPSDYGFDAGGTKSEGETVLREYQE